MDAFRSVETAKAVSANAIGLPAPLRAFGPTRRRGRGASWGAARVETLCAMLRAGDTFEQVGAAMGISRNAVAGQIYRMRKAGDQRLPEIRKPGERSSSQPRAPKGSGTGQRRFGSILAGGKAVVLAADHPAV